MYHLREAKHELKATMLKETRVCTMPKQERLLHKVGGAKAERRTYYLALLNYFLHLFALSMRLRVRVQA